MPPLMMKKNVFLLLLWFGMSCVAQDYVKSSFLKQAVLQAPKDTATISHFITYLNTPGNSLPKDTLAHYWKLVHDLSAAAGYDSGVGASGSWFGNYFNAKGDYTQSLRYLFEAEKSFEKLKSYKRLAGTYNLIGNTYMGLGNNKGQKEYFTKCYDLAVEHKLTGQMAYGAGGLGNYYTSLKSYEEAIKWNLVAARLFKETHNYIGYAIINTNIAAQYRELHDMAKAEEFVNLSEQSLGQANLNYASFVCYQEKGQQADLKKNYPEALSYYTKALNLMLEDKANHNISESYKALSDVAYKAGQYKEAADYLKGHVQYKDSIFNETNSRQLLDVQEKYETEKKDVAIEILNKENDLSKSELNRKKVLIYSGISVVVLLLILFVFVIKSNIRKNKTNALLERQKVIIEEKQKEIVDSINYARRIQYTLLANQDMLNALLPQHFILFEPKDIVSGDFYWLTNKGGFTYLAVCDCTGHGVPGAFMSLLSSNFLNEAINEKNLSDPGQVLDYVREKLINNLDGGNDGMDAILLKIPEAKGGSTEMEWHYAAANNKLIRVRGQELEELAADKMPVGKGEKVGNFATRGFKVMAGDMLYLYTDGYADQFGGEKGKKFKYKTLNQLLRSIGGHSAAEQENTLRRAFTDWKGSLEQVDDVCIIGIRV
jgi:serine phosphatase RsbU (regulator of sigma subunit)